MTKRSDYQILKGLKKEYNNALKNYSKLQEVNKQLISKKNSLDDELLRISKNIEQVQKELNEIFINKHEEEKKIVPKKPQTNIPPPIHKKPHGII